MARVEDVLEAEKSMTTMRTLCAPDAPPPQRAEELRQGIIQGLSEILGMIEVWFRVTGRPAPTATVLMESAAELLGEALTRYRERTEGGSFKERMERYEYAVLVDAMHRARGVQSQAARLLRTTPRILAYRLRRLGLH